MNERNLDNIAESVQLIVRTNGSVGLATIEKLEEIATALDSIAKSQKSIADSLVFITGVLDQRL